jgi:hypothetical protein
VIGTGGSAAGSGKHGGSASTMGVGGASAGGGETSAVIGTGGSAAGSGKHGGSASTMGVGGASAGRGRHQRRPSARVDRRRGSARARAAVPGRRLPSVSARLRPAREKATRWPPWAVRLPARARA